MRAAAPDPDRLAVGVNLGLVVADEDTIDDAIALRFGPLGQMVRPGILAGSPAQITDRVGQYVEAGAQWVILALRAPFELDALAVFAQQVAPAFTDRGGPPLPGGASR